MKVELPELPSLPEHLKSWLTAYMTDVVFDYATDYARAAVTTAIAEERARWEAEVAELVAKWRDEADYLAGNSAKHRRACADELAGLTTKPHSGVDSTNPKD